MKKYKYTPKRLFCLEKKLTSALLFVFDSQNGPIQNRETKRCLEIATGQSDEDILILRQCSGQKWKIQNLIKDN